MSMATIGGVVVKFTEFRRLADERVGGPRRTVSGSLRGDVIWAKKAWSGTAYAVDATESDTLRAQANPSTPVTVTGDLLHGASLSAIVEVLDATPVRKGSTFYEMLSLSIREA